MFVSRGPLQKTLHTIPIYRSSEQQQWCPRSLTLGPFFSAPLHPDHARHGSLIKGRFPALETCWSRESGLCDCFVIVYFTSETGLDETYMKPLVDNCSAAFSDRSRLKRSVTARFAETFSIRIFCNDVKSGGGGREHLLAFNTRNLLSAAFIVCSLDVSEKRPESSEDNTFDGDVSAPPCDGTRALMMSSGPHY